ncbi:MAG: CHAT domain-containing protein [Myxococcota bacterium]|nr:CHAT domain-containing protein [Myxococcota bacterium]
MLLLAVAACALASRSPSESPDDRHATLRGAGDAAFAREEYTAAVRHWEEALPLATGAPRAGLLHQLARAEEITGRFAASRRHARECVAWATANGDAELEARCENASSLAERRLDAPIAAREAAQRALARADPLGDPALLAESHTNLGGAEQALRRTAEALAHYEEALAVASRAGDRPAAGRARNNTGGLYRRLGRYERAGEHYRAALRAALEVRSKLAESRVRGNLCALLYALSDPEGATPECARALDLAEEIGARPQQANVLNTLAALSAAEGSFRRARRRYEQSAEIKRSIGDRGGLARTLNNLGDLYTRSGDHEEAARLLRESLAIKQELGDLAGRAATLGSLGRLHAALGEYEAAASQFAQALTLHEGLDRPELLWRTYDNLSLAQAALGRPAVAVYFGKRAVNTIQSIRAASRDLAPRHRQSYLDARTDVYRRLADLLIGAGRLLEAEQVLALLKEQEYRDYRRGGDAGTGPAGRASSDQRESAADEAIAELRRGLVEIASEFEQLRQRRHDLSAAEEQRFDALRAELVAANERFESFLAELERSLERDDPDGSSFPSAELASLNAFRGTLKNLDPDVVAIHLLPGPDRLRILVTSSHAVVPSFHRESPVERAALDRLIFELREKLQQPALDPRPQAQRLYDLLLRPIESELRELGAKTLLVYLDRNLRYLPIAALHDGDGYVAERFAVAVYTPATRDKLALPAESRWRVAALGLSEARQGFSPLPSVVRELDAIVKEGDEDATGVVPGIQRLNDGFDRQSLSDALVDGFPVIHLASHFSLGMADESFLLLGAGEPLRLEELNPIEYPMLDVDLLTLSACQTAMGGTSARGAEFEGFSVLAQREGASSVIATLWEVADESTGTFMQYFYDLHERHELTKAEALRMTQHLFIRGEVEAPDGATVSLRGSDAVLLSAHPMPTPYAHPFFWAPFVLSGNWL